ncbi:hotdog fold thioesterase [Kribbella sp. NPDC049584]|uniref:PaaI family thioesterase n=1 Tax=Kribbella sp. NPDC049584 TaxID=3154833 RepID=UPI003438BA44
MSDANALPPELDMSNTLLQLMGIIVVQASPERVVATMPVKGNTQPYGLLHGGASCVLAESVGTIGAALHAAGFGMGAVGIDLNATHHRAVRDGHVTAVANAIHLGRTTASYEIVITNDLDKRICTARLTCQLIPIPPNQ